MLDLKKKETLRISYDALIIENKREIMYQDILFIYVIQLKKKLTSLYTIIGVKNFRFLKRFCAI